MKSVNVRPIDGGRLLVQFGAMAGVAHADLMRIGRNNGLPIISDARPNLSFAVTAADVSKLDALTSHITVSKVGAQMANGDTLADAAQYVLKL